MIGEPLLITRPEIKAIADRLSATPAQVLYALLVDPEDGGPVLYGSDTLFSRLAWSQVGGHSVIPKSVTPARIVENFKEINLPPDDIATINDLGKVPKRYNTPYAYCK